MGMRRKYYQSCATGDWGDRYLEVGEIDTTIMLHLEFANQLFLEFDGVDDFVISSNEVLQWYCSKIIFARFTDEEPVGVQYVAGWGWDGEGPQQVIKISPLRAPFKSPALYSSNNNLMMWSWRSKCNRHSI